MGRTGYAYARLAVPVQASCRKAWSFMTRRQIEVDRRAERAFRQAARNAIVLYQTKLIGSGYYQIWLAIPIQVPVCDLISSPSSRNRDLYSGTKGCLIKTPSMTNIMQG